MAGSHVVRLQRELQWRSSGGVSQLQIDVQLECPAEATLAEVNRTLDLMLTMLGCDLVTGLIAVRKEAK